MNFKWNKAYLLSIILLGLRIWMTSQDHGEDFYDKLLDYLYEIYPDFGQKLFEYNGTDFGVNTSVHIRHISKGYALQARTENGYGVFLSSTRRKTLNTGGEPKISERPHSVLYKCSSAVHYCSGNPGYCVYYEGDKSSKIIITSPHAGPLRPKSIPDRGAGCWDPINELCIYNHDCENPMQNIFKSEKHCETFEKDDAGATDIAETLVESLSRTTGSRPHLIVNRLHRVKLDVNRDIKLGAFGEREAEQAYNDFHNYIKQAKENFNGKWGLLIDIHGNSRGNWTMLGYGMYKYQFNEKPLKNPEESSLKSLAMRTNMTLEALVRGNNSLGHFMEEAECKVFPSPDNPSPFEKGYLTGGYITRHHGSKGGGDIDAIQMEVPNVIRKDDDQQSSYIAKITQAIVKFININYYQHGKIPIDEPKPPNPNSNPNPKPNPNPAHA